VIRDYPAPYMFRCIRILYLEGAGTTERQREEERNKIKEEEFTVYD
jgi:hypothetical protein